jgi:hypothetical protein
MSPRWCLCLAWLALAGCAPAPPAPQDPPAALLRLASPSGWPSHEAIERAHDELADARTVAVARTSGGAYVALRPAPGGALRIEPISPLSSDIGRDPWQVAAGDPFSPGQLVLTAGDEVVELTVEQVAPPEPLSEGALVASAYLRALASEGAATEAEMALPTASCSMDDEPYREARRRRARCLEEGRFGCALHFAVRLLGDDVARVAWSSATPALNPPEHSGLDDQDVDLAVLYEGLLLDLAHPDPIVPVVWPDRVGRAVAASARRDKLLPVLEALVRSDTLDTWNRTRAAMALSIARSESESPAGPSDLSDLEVTDAARAWLQGGEVSGRRR